MTVADTPPICHYCQQVLSPERTWTYRPHPDDPLLLFCTPDCRNDYVDGYGLTAEDWWRDAPDAGT